MSKHPERLRPTQRVTVSSWGESEVSGFGISYLILKIIHMMLPTLLKDDAQSKAENSGEMCKLYIHEGKEGSDGIKIERQRWN